MSDSQDSDFKLPLHRSRRSPEEKNLQAEFRLVSKNAGEAKPSIRGVISQAELDKMDSMTDEQLEGSIEKAQKKLTSVLKKMLGNESKEDDLEKVRKRAERSLQKKRHNIFSPAETQTFNRLMDLAHKRSGDKTPVLLVNISWDKLFNDSPQSQAAKATEMVKFMKDDPVLSHLTTTEQQELSEMFAKRWYARRKALLDAKLTALLKSRGATELHIQATKAALPQIMNSIDRGELTDEVLKAEIADAKRRIQAE